MLVAAVVVIVLVAGGAFYALQQPPPTSTPTATPTLTPSPSSTVLPTPTASPPPTTTPTPTIDPEEQKIRDLIQAGEKAINSHSLTDIMSQYTQDIEISFSIIEKPYKGLSEVEKLYSDYFKGDPTASIKDFNVTDIIISGENAEAKVFGIQFGKWGDIAFTYKYAHFYFAKVGGEWKVKRISNVYYSEISAPKLTNTVTIDGKWTTPEEWKDAVEMPMEAVQYGNSPNNGTAFLRVKHDESNLYVLIDYVSDTTPRSPPTGSWWENAVVYFDPGRKGGWTPQEGDYCYEIAVEPAQQWKGRVQAVGGKWDWYKGDNSEQIQKLMGFSSNTTNDPYTTKHSIYEFKMPLPDQKELGFYVGASDQGGKSYMTWPGKVGDGTPQAWGVLKLK